MRSAITARGQTVIPAEIRAQFGLGPQRRLEWFVDAAGQLDPVQAFRGAGRPGDVECLLADRVAELLYRVWKDEGEPAGRLAHEQLLVLPQGGLG